MSLHFDKITSHNIFNEIESTNELIDSISELRENSPAALDVIERIKLIVNNFSFSLDSCNKNLIAISWLDESRNALLNIKSPLNSYRTNRDVNSLERNTVAGLDSLLQNTVRLNCIKSTRSFKNIVAAEENYASSMTQYSNMLYNKVQEMDVAVDILQKHIDDTTISLEKKVEEFQTAINTEKQRLDNLATSYQTQMNADNKAFIEMNTTMDKSFNNEQIHREKSFQTELENISNKSIELENNNNKLIEEYSQQFNRYKMQIENMVGIINANTFSHKYKQVADTSRKSARIWHVLAVILMIIVGAFSVYAFVITTTADTSWVKLVAKIFATTTLVTSAAYAARQASKQEKVERYARKIEMELVAIDPFIASLDDAKRSTIKEEIARKIFGNENALEITSKDEAYTALDKLTAIEDLLIGISKIINKVSNSSK